MSRKKSIEIDQGDYNWVWNWFQRTIQVG